MLHRSLPLIPPLAGWLRQGRDAGVPDEELLRRVAEHRDESAFAAIFDRHGARVWGVCRRIAGDSHVAEDVLQATFLLLIRKPRAVRNPSALAAWLHGVAYRLSVQARRQARRRAAAERIAPADHAKTPLDDLSSRELFAILDEELNRLPDFYREPLILCYIDGLTQDDAARRLRVSTGSLKGRLERGRARLAARLRRRGVAPSALLLASLAAVSVPAAASANTLKLIQPSAVVSAAVAALIRKPAMSIATRIIAACFVLVLTAVAGVGFALSGPQQPADNPPPAAKPEAPKVSETESLPLGAIARLGTTRLRPGGSIEFMAFSPDGKRLASLSDSDAAGYGSSIWDVATGKELKRRPLPGDQGRSLCWLTDGRGAAVLSLDWMNNGNYVLWDFTDDGDAPPKGNHGMPAVGAFPGNSPDNEADACFAVSPDGKFVAVSRSGNQQRERPVELREFRPGSQISDLKSIRKLGMHPANCDYLYFTPNGKLLLSINRNAKDNKPAKDLTVVVWDVANAKERRRLIVPAPIIQGHRPALAVSNNFLAVGMEDEAGTLRLFDLDSGKERSFATGHKAPWSGGGYGVSAVAFSPNGQTIVTGGRDNLIRIWDASTQRLRHTLKGHHSWVETFAISPDGKMLASGGQDGVIRLWDLATAKDLCPQPGHTGGLAGVTLSADGKTAVTAGRDGTMRIWDVDRAQELRTIPTSGATTRGVISPDRRAIVAGGHDQPLRLWDAATGGPITPPGDVAKAKATQAEFFNSQTLLTFRDGAVNLWNWPAGTVRQTFELPQPEKKPGTPYCQDASLSADGKLLVTVANRYWYREERGMRFGYAADGVIDLWDVKTGKRIRRLLQSQGCPRAAIFTAGGELIIQGGGQLLNADGTVETELKAELNLIDPLTSRLRRSFASMPVKPGVSHRYVMALALSPDGRSLYVADSSGVVVVYEVGTGQIRRIISGHRGLLTGLSLSRDGKRMVTASLDATALVWDLSPAQAFPRPAQAPTADELAKAWQALAETGAAAAFRAMGTLEWASKESVALISSKILPAPPGPAADLFDRLVAELASDKFAVREKATAELRKLGETAVPALRQRLAKTDSAEAHRRLVRLLDDLDPPEASPKRLQTQRALELLEMLGTSEAKGMLEKLAAGAPGASLTQAARQALDRLAAGN